MSDDNEEKVSIDDFISKNFKGGNLNSPDTSWMDKPFKSPSEPPIEVIPSGITKANKSNDVGIWTHFNYRVAKDSGLLDTTRRTNLMKIYISKFVPGKNADVNYLNRFGEPMSNQRHKKIQSYLTSQISTHENNPRMKNVVDKWKRDKEWYLRYVGNRH
tara:strand:+ start:92 stop:568 length:477 start_codon:yes stop_codon:yes gene_type:complete